jgi:hypothetical protein
MAKIRFEDVTITAKAIELDGIEDPSSFMKGLGLQDANVIEDITDERPRVEAQPVVVEPTIEAQPVVEEELPQAPPVQLEASEVTPEMLSSARRLRDVVQVFMDAKITDADDIVDICMRLKSDVSILGRMSDIPGRMPIAVNKWLEQNA